MTIRFESGSASRSAILVIDDDVDIACAAQLLLRRQFGATHVANGPDNLPAMLATIQPDLVLLDLNFTPGRIDGGEGMKVLDTLLRAPNAPAVIAMTAYADVPLAVTALKRGAVDFITKPWDNDHLCAVVKMALDHRRHNGPESVPGTPPAVGSGGLLGQSQAMQNLRAMIASVAPTQASVLILGENGVGKELVARAIHEASRRALQAFLAVDMGALPETMLESELFGHRKGAFTGASGDRSGRFQAARGGTIFLDEIGNLPLSAQAKLLTVLERREVTPVGADRATAIDVRVISATNLPELKLYQPEVFRPDLLFRLNTIVIRVPPLRERIDDLPALLNHFIGLFERQYQKRAGRVSPSVQQQLVDYRWPGNVRELRQACERAVILSSAAEYDWTDFGLMAADVPDSASISLQPVRGTSAAVQALDALERDAIQAALERSAGNISHASRALGISRPALYRKMEKYGL